MKRAIRRSVIVKNPNQKKNTLKCQSCDKAFSKQFDLVQHERCHTGEKPFACEICGKTFSQKSNMKKHLNDSHRVWPEALLTLRPISNTQDIFESINKYSCPFCTLAIDSYSKFKKHLADNHTNEKVYKCLSIDCIEKFYKVEEFIQHTKKHQSNNESCDTPQCPQIENKSWKCEICKIVFERLESLKWHLSVERHKHVCPQCNATFIAERYLRRHLAGHGEPIICPICNKSLKYGQTFKTHMILHQPQNAKYACDICDKRFINNYRLKRHIAIHSDKPFVCTYRKIYGCEKRFSRKDKFLSHIRTHKQNASIQVPKHCDKNTQINVAIYYKEFPSEN